MYKFTWGTFPSCFHHFIIFLDSWGTFPSHSHFAALIYPTFGTHGHLDFSFDCPKIVSGPFSEISVSFLFNYMDFIYFHQIMSFQTIYQCIMAWGINPSHSHCSSLIFMAYHHGALNLPIYLGYVGHSFLPTAKYTNFGIYPGFFTYFSYNHLLN